MFVVKIINKFMGKLEKIMEQFEKLSQNKKDRIVKHYLERLDHEAEDIKKHEQLLADPNQNKLARELQERHVQCCIDYIKETGDTNIDRVIFTADALQESSKYGSWQACTDSTCELEKLTEDGYENISFSA
jgi:hypothetical protein